MKTIFNHIVIDLITQDSVTLILPNKISINELHYKMQYKPEYSGIVLFLDVVDGKEKLIMLTLNEKGITKLPLNQDNIFKSVNFKVEKIIFNCFRKIEFSFTLLRQTIK